MIQNRTANERNYDQSFFHFKLFNLNIEKKKNARMDKYDVSFIFWTKDLKNIFTTK